MTAETSYRVTVRRMTCLGDDPVEPTACTAVFDEAVQCLRAAIEKNGTVVTHDDLPILMAVRAQLFQLCQNLIGNAMKCFTSQYQGKTSTLP